MYKKEESGAGVSLKRTLISAAVGYCLIFIAAAVFSLLISKGALGEDMMSTCVVISAYIGALVGALTARGRGVNRFASAGAVVGIMAALRFIVAAFGEDGSLLSATGLISVAAMALGALTAAIPSYHRKKRRKTSRR